MSSSAEPPVARGLIPAVAGVLVWCAGCGGGGATIPTVTFRPEAVEDLAPAEKPAGEEPAAPAAGDAAE